jgi:hypothetical protein
MSSIKFLMFNPIAAFESGKADSAGKKSAFPDQPLVIVRRIGVADHAWIVHVHVDHFRAVPVRHPMKPLIKRREAALMPEPVIQNERMTALSLIPGDHHLSLSLPPFGGEPAVRFGPDERGIHQTHEHRIRPKTRQKRFQREVQRRNLSVLRAMVQDNPFVTAVPAALDFRRIAAQDHDHVAHSRFPQPAADSRQERFAVDLEQSLGTAHAFGVPGRENDGGKHRNYE